MSTVYFKPYISEKQYFKLFHYIWYECIKYILDGCDLLSFSTTSHKAKYLTTKANQLFIMLRISFGGILQFFGTTESDRREQNIMLELSRLYYWLNDNCYDRHISFIFQYFMLNYFHTDPIICRFVPFIDRVYYFFIIHILVTWQKSQHATHTLQHTQTQIIYIQQLQIHQTQNCHICTHQTKQ